MAARGAQTFGDKGRAGPAAARKYRDALGCFATGVAVVTTVATGGEKIGITVNSFTSVSVAPPLILWCLSLDSGLVKHFRKKTPFAVNFLAAGQRALAVRFARPGKSRFAGIVSAPGRTGAPVLTGIACLLECETAAVRKAGDHVIILGRVLSFRAGAARPLLFHRSHFRAL